MADSLSRLPAMRSEGGRLARFGAVGVAAFGVDAAVLGVAVHVLDLSPYAGRAVSYLAAATAAWALNRRYTFASSASLDPWFEWIRYLVSNGAGALFNLGTYVALIGSMGFFYRYPVLAAAFGALAGMAVNFLAARRFVFRGAPEAE